MNLHFLVLHLIRTSITGKDVDSDEMETDLTLAVASGQFLDIYNANAVQLLVEDCLCSISTVGFDSQQTWNGQLLVEHVVQTTLQTTIVFLLLHQ